MKIQKMRDQNIGVCAIMLNGTKFKILVSLNYPCLKSCDPYMEYA